MVTLVIHAPERAAKLEQKRSFEETLTKGVGDGYAIPLKLAKQLSHGCPVVILDKEREKRARGTLVKLDPRDKTKSGMQRYDIYFENVKEEKYQEEALSRTGIAVF